MVGFGFSCRNSQVVWSRLHFPGAALEPGDEAVFGVGDTAGMTDKSLRRPGAPSSTVTAKGPKHNREPPSPSSALWRTVPQTQALG